MQVYARRVKSARKQVPVSLGHVKLSDKPISIFGQ
jgi:hypothetical protein